MDYQESLDWLYGTQLFGIKLGLENVQRLAHQLDAFPTDAKVLHIAGTNGKGSVCAMAESIARAAGYKTGLFTSPHLIRYNERIKINGADLPDAEIAEELTHLRKLVENWETHPTFFELTTILGLRAFKRHRCEVIILETGLGGRLDATNIITPDVSILTQIDLDHAQWLGDTLEKIAAEKAGIIKTGNPVVTFTQSRETLAVFRKTAQTLHSELTILDSPFTEFPSSLAGKHQTWNAALAICGLQKATLPIHSTAIAQGLQNLSWPGRFQQIRPQIYLDGAHNPAAARMLVQTWQAYGPAEKPTILIGMLADKDIAQTLSALAPLADSWITIAPNSQRTISPLFLAENIREISSHPVRIADSLAHALSEAPLPLLICGSLFLVGEALAFFNRQPTVRSTLQ